MTSLPPDDGGANGTSAIVFMDLANNWNMTGPIPPSWVTRLPNACIMLHNTSLCGAVPDGMRCFRKDATRLGARARGHARA